MAQEWTCAVTSRELPAHPCLSRHTAGMALRFAVQADTEQECAAGLRLLESFGLQPAMRPKQLTDDRWMARAVPRMAKAPTEDDPGRGPGVSG